MLHPVDELSIVQLSLQNVFALWFAQIDHMNKYRLM